MDKIKFSQALQGYTLYAHARRLSEHTLADYSGTFRKLAAYLKTDLLIADITPTQVREFLAVQTVSDKTLLNYHTGLSSLWHWATTENIVTANIIRQIKPPKPEEIAIVPYSEADIHAMLRSLDRSRNYSRPGKRESSHAILNANRNRAIILILLDTGIRASELSELRINKVDVQNRHIVVMGKGDKERQIPFGPRTGQAIWRYLSTRQESLLSDYLIVTRTGAQLRRDELAHLISDIGDRAGVQGSHVHRFRHTFAINYLRNGGDVFTLQKILGHSTMEMVCHYLDIAKADVQAAHRMASPVEHWRL
jgi:site-specific recombinase XerD